VNAGAERPLGSCRGPTEREHQVTTRSRPGSRAKGQERINEVLDAAEHQLKLHGSEGLTIRAVAEDVGISVGNLQYYFPTRAELLDAVFQRMATVFEEQAVGDDLPDNPRDRLVHLVRYWLEAQYTQDQSLFWHLWAISAHDPAARMTMDSIYGRLLAGMAAELKLIHPTLGTEESSCRAATIAALVDGSGLFAGFGRTDRPELQNLHQEIMGTVTAIIDLLPASRPR
jgi:AcrR family transcriptional regulator